MATAHARLVRAAERKLRDFGIPPEELGFLSAVTRATGGGVGRGARGMDVGGGRGRSHGKGKGRMIEVSVNKATVRG